MAYVVDVAAIARPPPTRDTTTVPIGLHVVPLIVALNVPFVRKPPMFGSTVAVPDEPHADDTRTIAPAKRENESRRITTSALGRPNMRRFDNGVERGEVAIGLSEARKKGAKVRERRVDGRRAAGD